MRILYKNITLISNSSLMNNMEHSEFKLDEKDKKILIELQKDSRASFSKISKTVKVPKTVVAYRIKRLVDNGFLKLFCTIINKKHLGYIHAQLFLKLQNVTRELENKLVSFLKSRKGIHWVASLNGCYDFAITFLAKNLDELNEIYEEIIYRFSKNILEKDLNIVIRSNYFPIRYIFGDSKQSEDKRTSKKHSSDKTDFKIINLLKQNSRIQLLDLSEKLDISPQTLRARITYLKKCNIIQGFKIRINPQMLGFHHFKIFISLSGVDKKKEEQITGFISELPSTLNIIKCTGRYDLEFEMLLKSHFELYELLTKVKNNFPDSIKNADVALVYKIHDINTVQYCENDSN